MLNNAEFISWYNGFIKSIPEDQVGEAGCIRISCWCGGCSRLYTKVTLLAWQACGYGNHVHKNREIEKEEIAYWRSHPEEYRQDVEEFKAENPGGTLRTGDVNVDFPEE